MMAKKGGSKGSLGFDYHNLTPDQKQKVSTLWEQFPEMERDNIAIVLEYHQFDSDKAVNCITTDGGATAYKNWNSKQTNQTKINNRNKKRNKKKNRKDDGPVSNTTLCTDADDSSSLHSSNIDFDGEKESNTKIDYCDDTVDRTEVEASSICSNLVSSPTYDELSLSDTLVENEISESPLRTVTDQDEITVESLVTEVIVETAQSSVKCDSLECEIPEKTNVASDSPREKIDEQTRHPSQKPFYRQRHGSSHHSKSSSLSEDVPPPQATTVQKRGGFTKCKKDLSRQAVSLQRIQSQLESHLEEASKCLKSAFGAVRKMLDERQEKLEEELEKVKEEALSLLKSRRDRALDLKRRSDRVQSLNDSEWNDLRADIKQFVTERKYDDELGKTIWFHWSVDAITEEVGKFGEVCPVKNTYSQRQLSRMQNSPEPNSPQSGAADEDSTLTALNTDAESALGSDGNTEMEEVKAEKDVQVKTAVQGESRSRVFSNKRYSQSNFGGRYPPNHNRGRGFYRGGRGHMGGNYNPRVRNYENYRQYGGERNNDYRQQFSHHDRTDFHHASDDKLPEAALNATENTNAGSRYPMTPRENQGHFRGHDRRPYGGFRSHRPFHNYGRSRTANRAPRSNSETAPSGTEATLDKNANYGKEVIQENKDIVNGY